MYVYIYAYTHTWQYLYAQPVGAIEEQSLDIPQFLILIKEYES